MSTAHRLLLVEDNPGDAELAREWLAALVDLVLEIEAVSSLKGALEALRRSTFDGIILDLNLPDSRGIDTLQRLLAFTSDIPIIIYAGGVGNRDVEAAANAIGVSDVIVKEDSHLNLLAHSVRSMLRRAKAERQHDQFESLVSVMPDAVIVTDRSGVVQFLNPAAQELFGRAVEDFAGEQIGFSVKEGESSDLEIFADGKRRAAELRIGECVWNRRPAYVAMMRDVTEEKRLADQLRQTQKMEALGLLAGGVAHDFNNLLLVMLLYADIIAKDPAGAAVREEAGEILQAVMRAQALTRQLMTFSRRQPIETTIINIDGLVTGLHSMLRRLLPSNIEITSDFAEGLWPVLGDRGQIEQVLINLAVNARDAMSEGGRFSLELRNVSIRRHERSVPPGDYLCLTISDTGTGMSDEVRAHIFDPFFTTKARGEGTGLGLATSYAIVTRMNGEITCQSAPGDGAQFTILLPRAEKPAEKAVSEISELEGLGGSETVLVVDDDQAVARAACRILESKGYTVLLAGNGIEARHILAERAEPVDLVLSDVVMPKEGGPALSEHLRRRFNGLPVVFMTGYSDHPIAHSSGESTINGFPALLKPFKPHELLKLVRSSIDGARDGAG
ncbi:response regulator [Consotaella aegiceratis]|uniref:response regulator n=1 Tax=Consotaella aegiceratis TaxID=3097961 RepID=UPI002F3F27E5